MNDDSQDTSTSYSGDAEDMTDPGRYWHEQIDAAKKVFEDWDKRGKKVIKRYRDERKLNEGLKSKFNILWSNIQVLFPSLYGELAKPQVSRRYMDADPVGRLASTILERTIEYEVEQFGDYHDAMTNVVEDRLLPGRGTAWIRYEAVIVQDQVPPVEGQGVENDGQITNTEEMTVERIESAHSPIDYVYWQDFLHSPARTWAEVWWVARAVYMTREEGIERFGAKFKMVGLSADNADADSKASIGTKSTFKKKAKIYEIWDKRTAKVCWIAEGYDKALDEKDDFLHLQDFFPCPKPLLATTTNGSMIPVPDYTEYQDQAEELDTLTNRISMLTKAIKVVGVFNGEFKELTRLLSEGVDNMLFPVTNWAALSEKGGLKGAIDLLDLTTQLEALRALYEAREAAKQTIYEIIGISDIMRGTSKAEETLGAQQLKANFGSIRLKSSQADVARFASDLFRLKAQIICQFYPGPLIIEMSGITRTDDGQNQELLQAAVALLQNGNLRDFQINVQSDTLAQIDDAQEKQGATEVLGVISKFLEQALPMVSQAPETLLMASEMLLFVVRRFRAGRDLEGAIEKAMKMLEQKAAHAAANPQPTPEEKKIQAQSQSDAQRMQLEAQSKALQAQQDAAVQQAKTQNDAQLEQMKLQMEAQKTKFQAQLDDSALKQEQRFEAWKAKLESETTLRVTEMNNKAALDVAKESVSEASVTA